MIKIIDHAAQALKRLVTQYAGKPSIEALATEAGARAQPLEDALWDLFTLRSLSQAWGAQLDGIGQIIGQPRNGETDSDYRVHLAVKIRLDKSSGTIAELVEMFSLLLPALTIRIVEQFPAGFVLRAEGGATPNGPLLASFLRSARAAGVGGIFEWYEVAQNSAFTLDAGPGLDVGHLAGAA